MPRCGKAWENRLALIRALSSTPVMGIQARVSDVSTSVPE